MKRADQTWEEEGDVVRVDRNIDMICMGGVWFWCGTVGGRWVGWGWI